MDGDRESGESTTTPAPDSPLNELADDEMDGEGESDNE